MTSIRTRTRRRSTPTISSTDRQDGGRGRLRHPGRRQPIRYQRLSKRSSIVMQSSFPLTRPLTWPSLGSAPCGICIFARTSTRRFPRDPHPEVLPGLPSQSVSRNDAGGAGEPRRARTAAWRPSSFEARHLRRRLRRETSDDRCREVFLCRASHSGERLNSLGQRTRGWTEPDPGST